MNGIPIVNVTPEGLKALALSVAVGKRDKETARDRCVAGNYFVDFTARIKGSVKIGEDFEKTPTCQIPWKSAFAALAHACGCVRGPAIAKVREAIQLAMREDTEIAEALLEAMPIIETTVAEIVDPMLQSLPKISAKGVVTTKLEVEFDPIPEFVTV